MGRRGYAESLAGHRMQVELLDRRTWQTRVELANAIFEYLEIFHNRQRRHSALGMLAPVELETRHQTEKVACSRNATPSNPGRPRASIKARANQSLRLGSARPRRETRRDLG